MGKLLKKRNENGFATVIVIVVIVVMGILLAGLIPLGTTVTQSAAYTRNILQAQYIAEAGAKRAIVTLKGGTYISPLKDNILMGGSGVENSYSVTILPPDSSLTSGSSTVDGEYVISSTGTYGRFSKRVTVKVTITTGSLPNLNAGFTIAGNINADSKVDLDGNINISVGKQIDSDITLKNGCKNAKSNQKITIPSLDYSKIRQMYAGKISDLPLPSSTNQNPTLNANTVYWYDNTLNFTYNDRGYNGPSSGYAIVVINGDLTWDATGCNVNKNILFLVNGKLIRKNGDTSFSSCCFYCNEADIYGTGSNFSAKMIVRGDLNLKSSLKNVNPTSYAFGNLTNDLSKIVLSGSKVSDWAKGV
jgi:type II secretory pathway pseudopilin PulG